MALQVLSVCLLLILLPSFGKSLDEMHFLEVSSLLPSSACNPSPLGYQDGSMQLVHKNGPCFSTAQQIPQDRVKAQSAPSSSSTTKHAAVAAAGDYVAKIGLGTPTKNLNLIVDTTSDSILTLCKKGAAFDPFVSTTYSNVSCERASCGAFTSMPGFTRNCAAATCTYAKHGSNGFFANDKVTIGTDTIPELYFGCAQEIKGRLVGGSGVLGLGRGLFSLNKQTEEKYGNVFSYCLPSKTNYVGRLSLGKGGISKRVKYTPLVTKSAHPSKYIVEVIAISVGGKKMGIPPYVLSESGTVIDSATAISRLPGSVYVTLTAAFGHLMVGYPFAEPLGILNHCYNLKGFKNVSVPKISFFFKGGVEVPLHSSGIFIGNGVEKMCLAFAANENDSDVSILGNVQQRTLNVVYDVAGAKIGFGVNGCR